MTTDADTINITTSNPIIVGETRDFLKTIGESDHSLVWMNPDSGGPHGLRGENSLDEAAKLNAGGKAIYYHLNTVKAGVIGKASKADIIEIRAVAGDIDWDRVEYPGNFAAGLAAVDGILRDMLHCALPPTLVVRTGGGIQPIWLLHAPVAANAETTRIAEAVGKGIASRWQGDAVGNIDRMLRLPGFINHPRKAKADAGQLPALARVEPGSGRRYTLEELAKEFMPQGPKGAPSAPAPPADLSALFDLGPMPALIKGKIRTNDVAVDNSDLTAGLFPHDPNEVLHAALFIAKLPGSPFGPGGYGKGWSAFVLGLAAYADEYSELKDRLEGVLSEVVEATGFRNLDDNLMLFNAGMVRARARRVQGKPITSLNSFFSMAHRLGWNAGYPLAAVVNSLFEQPTATSDAVWGTDTVTPRGNIGAVGMADLPAIPPKRRWLHGVDLVRGAVSLIVAPGARGKSSWITVLALACASGRQLLGQKVYGGPQRVLYINAEDSTDELALRLRAAMQHHKLTDVDLPGLMVAGADRVSFNLAKVVSGVALIDDGGWVALRALIEKHRPDVLILDPLVALVGGASLNDNAVAALLMRKLVVTAVEHKLAVLVAHHTAKGREVGSAEAAMGAASIVNLARIALALEPLAEDKAMAIGVSPDMARSCFRVVGTQQNLSAPSTDDRWFRIVSVDIDNEEPPTYPHGDKIGVVEIFRPNPVWAVTQAMRDAALDIIRTASPPLSPTPGSDGFAPAVIDEGLKARLQDWEPNESRAASIIGQLLQSGLIKVQTVKVRRPGKGAYPRKAYVAIEPISGAPTTPQQPQQPLVGLVGATSGEPTAPKTGPSSTKTPPEKSPNEGQLELFPT